ncbi:MAG TPA: hypothetical protein VGF00_09150, partial [Acidimicrobiia bacterium]
RRPDFQLRFGVMPPLRHHGGIRMTGGEVQTPDAFNPAIVSATYLGGSHDPIQVDDRSQTAEIPVPPRDRADGTERPGSLGYVLLAMLGAVALVGGGGLAAFTTGAAAWCGMLTWTIGIVVTLCAVATGEASRAQAPPTTRSACP